MRKTSTAKTAASVATSSALWRSELHTMIVLDWDDTLFPTTWLCGKRWFRTWVADKGGLDEEEQAARDADSELLGEMDKAARSFIVAASSAGQVCCVTLARRPWQSRTMQAFYPCLSELWQKLELQVRYAREEKSVEPRSRAVAMGRNADPESDMEEILREQGRQVRQKMKAMQKLIRQFYKDGSWKNVVSIGDGPAERQALKDLGFTHINPVSAKSGAQKELRIKTVQMVLDPSCEQLCGELQVLTSWIPPLVCLDRDFDVDLNASEEDLFSMQEQLADLLEAQ